jgi:hypothetical protein
MIRPFLFTAFLIAFLASGGACALAQSELSAQLLSLDSAFANGQYEQVELLSLRLLQDYPDLTPDEVARVNLTAGYALIMLNREAEARRCFARALDAVPDLALDPVQVSPKFRMVFDEVKASRPAQTETPPRPLPADTSAQRASSLFASAMWSNLVVPGSGQWKLGYRLRGALLFGAEATCLTLLIINATEMQDSRADYLAATGPETIRRAYERYNQDYQASCIAGISAAVVYLAAQADLVRLNGQASAVTMLPMTGAAGISFRVQW